MPNLVAIDVSVTDDRIRLTCAPPHHQPIPGYQRAPQLHTTTKEVSLSLPEFITWFITCRPDDEDSVTFTFVDEHAEHASRWAESMVLFEPVPGHDDDSHHSSSSYFVKQMHVRRLWNRGHLLKRLEELRRMAMTPTLPLTVPTGRMQRGDIWW
ncbi:hypothetical protein N0V88_007513 [Collariella sp. IMI 366227]|nr:hypothetical protein N0V88_007513 [Collariella sp. IMI 366227]